LPDGLVTPRNNSSDENAAILNLEQTHHRAEKMSQQKKNYE